MFAPSVGRDKSARVGVVAVHRTLGVRGGARRSVLDRVAHLGFEFFHMPGRPAKVIAARSLR
jgi:hypothetical protein